MIDIDPKTREQLRQRYGRWNRIKRKVKNLKRKRAKWWARVGVIVGTLMGLGGGALAVYLLGWW